MFTTEEVTGTKSPDSPADEQEVACSLSVHALTGSATGVSGVIQLQAFIEQHEVLILIDSGSSTLFINQQLSAKLSGIQQFPCPCKVNVADGTQHSCSAYIPQCSWTSQGHQFQTDLKNPSSWRF
jgi:hypothetical protein